MVELQPELRASGSANPCPALENTPVRFILQHHGSRPGHGPPVDHHVFHYDEEDCDELKAATVYTAALYDEHFGNSRTALGNDQGCAYKKCWERWPFFKKCSQRTKNVAPSPPWLAAYRESP